MKAIFEVSDNVATDNLLTDQPLQVVVILPEDWVQLTYEALRSAPNGDDIAYFGTDGWWHYQGMKFSDVILTTT